MGFLATVLACLCLPIYIPLILNSARQIMAREVVLTRWSFLNLRVTRLTGGAALVYSVAQLLGGIIVVSGLFRAVGQDRLLPIFTGIAFGWLIGIIGGFLARTMQSDITEYNVGPRMYTRTTDEYGRTVYTRTTPDGQTETKTEEEIRRMQRGQPGQMDDEDDGIVDAEYRILDDDDDNNNQE